MYLLDDSFSELIENKTIKYSFIYDNANKEYIQLAPNRESGKLSSILGPGTKPGYFLNSGVWIYLKKDFIFSPNSIDNPASIDVLELMSGWSIFSITPDMIGKELEDIKGDCNIEKAYVWEAEHQGWINFIEDPEFYSESEGMGIVIKTTNNCKFSASSTSPPALPVKCEDEDGGVNYEQKGNTWSTKHLNSWGEIVTDNYYGAGDACCTKCDFGNENWVDTGNHTGYFDDKGIYLREGYCDEFGVARTEKYECPNGCIEGACI